MTHPLTYPARRCITCAHLDEDGCSNGFPEGAISCTAHQTETESEFYIHASDHAPIAATSPMPAGVQ